MEMTNPSTHKNKTMTRTVGCDVCPSQVSRTIVVLVFLLITDQVVMWISSSMDGLALLSAIEHKKAPMLTNRSTSADDNDPPFQGCIPIYLVPSSNDRRTRGEHHHFVVDGIHKSPHLRITNNNTEGNVWIIDMMRSNGCEEILSELHNATIARKNAYGGKLTSSNSSNWTIIHNDWSDKDEHKKCDGMDAFVGEENIRWMKRSTVSSRSIKLVFNNTGSDKTLNDWILDPGYVSITPDKAKYMPYNVRTDHVETIASMLRQNHGITDYPNETWNLADLNRSLDGDGIGVCHFWHLRWSRRGASQLRDAVSFTIDGLRKDKNISAFVGVQGRAGEPGRTRANAAYVENLLRCQIVVVTQRDWWEDHYRLMEALSSGSMVLCDPMLHLPSGLSEGNNIVFFHSKSDLEEKILFYLGNETARIEVAQKGWKEAMSRHRSWHYVEDLVFGKIQTEEISTPKMSSCF